MAGNTTKAPKPGAELTVRMVSMLSGLTPQDTLEAGREYRLPAAVAERYFDYGIAEVVDAGWVARAPRGTDEEAAIARIEGTEVAAVAGGGGGMSTLNTAAAIGSSHNHSDASGTVDGGIDEEGSV